MDLTTAVFGVPTETINALAGVATAVAAMLAAVFAYRGLCTWRDEMLGRRKAELAEEVLADFYQARDVFRLVRSPGGFSGEARDRPRENGEEEALSRDLDSYFVPIARLKYDRAFLSAFYAKRFRFRAVFDAAAEKPFLEMKEIDAQITSAANMLSRLAQVDATRGAAFRREQHYHTNEAIIWDQGEPDDAINPKVDAAVKAIEIICRPAIEARNK
jgi:hypothetical protein